MFVTLGAGGDSEVQISVIDTPISIEAAEKIQVAEEAEAKKAEGNSSVTQKPKARVSPLVLCTPEGTTFAPPIKVRQRQIQRQRDSGLNPKPETRNPKPWTRNPKP